MSNKWMILAGALTLCTLNSAQAEEIRFLYPAACQYGSECWAVNYVDVDPAKNSAKDFKCNGKTYDGHKGSDFALSGIGQMRAGVDVLAAASGRVVRVRDGESDRLKTPEELDNVRARKRECGNGVLIDHGQGLKTIYCHLKNGSITVAADDAVKAGEKIAQIGQSGVAEFPHLHFGVLVEDGIIDPYTGLSNQAGCGKAPEPMWHIGLPIEYEPVAIFDGGFRSRPPDFEAIKRGEQNPESLSLASAALVFWTGLYNIESGDVVTLHVHDPDGMPFVSRRIVAERDRARQYYFTGRKIGRVQLKPGTYTGVVELQRSASDERAEVRREKRFTVDIE